MKPITLKRIQLIGAIILFLGAFVVPRITCGTTIYVDDDNTSGPWDGTMEHPYQHIQDGINHSSSGDTVFVFNGVYYENVVVNRSIDLTGENRDSAIIDGRGIGNVVSVAGGAKISKFTIQNSGENGIFLSASSNNTISGNTILSNGHGIFLEYHSNSNFISDNTIETIGTGVLITELSYKNTVTKNTVTRSGGGIYVGVYSDSSLISENTIADVDVGVTIEHSRYNIVTENIFTNNSYAAIDVENAFNNNISGNTITNSINSEYGFWVEGRYNTIRDNDIANTRWGIFLFFDCFYDTIIGNTIRDCERGMILEEAAYTTIAENTLINNGTGIWSWSGPNLIYNNNFFNNTQDAYEEDTPNNWNNGYPSGGNYWDDFDEPIEGAYDNYYGPDQNIPGSDGIVDTSYSIPGELSQDRYPLMEPWSGSLPTAIFVDDDNTTGPWDGTPAHPFQYVQEGIKNAKKGDIVNVRDGTYCENVSIDKKLILVGENMDRVIVDGGGNGEVVNISSDTVRIRKFTVQHGSVGIRVWSNDNAISENIITDNTLGLGVESPSTSNFIFHNNFINNTQQAYDPSINFWDLGYPCGGNYWDDYTSSDNYYGPNQNIPGSDGIGDTPYSIPGGSNQDNYPLMNPWDGSFPVPPRDNVYVDDDFDENTPGWGYDRFDKIQDGIDSVVMGGTVHVSDGSYYENVVVDKTINLIGENKDSTVVDGNSGDVVLISADSVYMTGFTVKNGLKGIDLFPSSNSRVVENITTDNSSCGIRLANSKNNTISNNAITRNNLYGIDLNHSNDNRIYMNIIKDNGYGVLDNHSSNNTIYHNDFINNSQNAYAVYDNFWDNRYPSGGNHWDDYAGVDSFSGPNQNLPGSDGIGDTPHNVTPGVSYQDHYPLMNTCCGLYANANGPYAAFADESIQFNGIAHGNSPPYSWHWEFGDGDTSPVQNPTHAYSTVGKYTAKLTITDSLQSSDLDTAMVTIKPRLSSVWVDDDFDENTPGWGYDHFNHINGGIEAVYYGGSVYVSNGTYHEYISINKTINLIGWDKDSAIINGDTGDVVHISVDSVTISGFTIQNSGGFADDAGIDIWSSDNAIHQNNIISNHNGIYLHSSSNSVIYGNNITTNSYGIKLAGSSNNTIAGNIITDNRWYSIRSDNSSDSNIIHHNNFVNNNQNVFDEGKNIWDNGYPSGGNFWDDYTGSDTFSGPSQNIPGSDGIGDIPYSVPVGNRDNYPLMHPRSPYVCGDANGDGVINSADVVYLINHVYANGPAPPLLPIGDANSDGVVDIDDVVYLIRYLFTGGPAPTC